MYRVLFVCSGNICRSPTAEGVLRKKVAAAGLVKRIGIDSAGTHGYHQGEPPDSRTQEAALRRGIDLSDQRARAVVPEDFERFDLILAMAREHQRHLERARPQGAKAEIKLFLDFVPEASSKDVPDPYYGGPDGFEHVLDLIEAGAQAIFLDVQNRLDA
ncbi:MAG: low molecular weight phosphotyrosine protein phosphatase [Rhodospirillales bacterium]|nr:low molecular weight phosphotyrosine protein phosphatase [Rhodospirillales bacterium]